MKVATADLRLDAEHHCRQKLAAYPPDHTIVIPRNACGMLEFDRADEMIELGRQAAEEQMPRPNEEQMKLGGFEDIDPGVRAFILITVAIAYPAWDFGFELGAFGQLFYEKIFLAWSISTALLLVLLFIPKEKLEVPRLAWFATAIPSFWLVLALAIRVAPDAELLGQALTVTGFVAYLACFPYVIYMAVSIVYPDLLRITQLAPRIAIGVIIAGLVSAGFVAGRNHPHFLTCEDFALSGNYVPENCTPAPVRK